MGKEALSTDNKENVDKFAVKDKKLKKVMVPSRYADIAAGATKTKTLQTNVHKRVPVVHAKLPSQTNVSVSIPTASVSIDSQVSKPTKAELQPEKNQSFYDKLYCQYVQSVYLSNYFREFVKDQEDQFREHYSSLNSELENITRNIAEVDSSIQILSVAKDIDNYLNEQLRCIEALLNCIRLDKLDELNNRITAFSQIVVVDENLDVGEVDATDSSNLIQSIGSKVHVDGVESSVIFGELLVHLNSINELIETQMKNIEEMRKVSNEYVVNLLMSVPNINVDTDADV